MPTLNEFRTQATTEIENEKPLYKNVDNVHLEFNDTDYEYAIEMRAQAYFNEQQTGYITNRAEAYGSIAEQLDMMYWDNVNGTTNWKDHIAQVKADYPKAEPIEEEVVEEEVVEEEVVEEVVSEENP